MKGETRERPTGWADSITEYPQNLRGQGNTYIKSSHCTPWGKNEQEGKGRSRKEARSPRLCVNLQFYLETNRLTVHFQSEQRHLPKGQN